MDTVSIDNSKPKTYLNRKNVFGFAASGFGQNMIISVVNSYLMFFYTNIFIIEKSVVTVIMLIARIWDVVNDPMMGMVVDKTRTKLGKMRPYLLAVFIPLGLCTCLLFMTPNFSTNGKIAYAAITYLIWGMVYTVCDIPFWGLPAAMTRNPEERVKFISFSRIFHSLGGASPFVIIFIMEAVCSTKAMAYKMTGYFAGIVGGLLFFLAFYCSEERFVADQKTPSIRECLSFLKINKPMQKVVLSHITGFGCAITVAGGMYVATALIGDITPVIFGKEITLSATTMNTIISASFAVTGFIAMIFTPKLCEKYNYKQIYFGSTIVGIIAPICMLICGAKTWSILLWLAISGIPYGLVCNINYSMISDSIDYVEWKTGQRAEGITVSFQTFTNKACTTLQTLAVSLILIVFKYVQPEQNAEGGDIYLPQSDAFKNGLFITICLLPIVCWIIRYLFIRGYTFLDEERATATRELAEREKQKDVNNVEIITDAPASDEV